jgi:peptidoglycan-associated lipoprotein
MRPKASLAIVLSIACVIVLGCAKRPAMTQATAPAPTGAVVAPPAAPPVAPPAAAAPPAPTQAPRPAEPAAPPPPPISPPVAERPAPREFLARPELGDIHFDFDKYAIRPGDARILDAAARWLQENRNHLVLIEGHCDERGTSEYNLALGERRARAARNYLVGRGVQAERITITSYGKERPLCTDSNERCWARNRRAHFLVKPR